MHDFLFSIISLYEGLILLRVLVSWFASPTASHPALDLLKNLTDPILDAVRKALPATGSIDFSPLVVLIGLELLKRLVA